MFITSINIRAMASKMITMKFEAKIFDGKHNFLLRKMRVMMLLVNEGTLEAPLGADKKLSKMEDDEWVHLDVRAKATIILCLSDGVLYSVVNKL